MARTSPRRAAKPLQLEHSQLSVNSRLENVQLNKKIKPFILIEEFGDRFLQETH